MLLQKMGKRCLEFQGVNDLPANKNHVSLILVSLIQQHDVIESRYYFH